MKILKVCIFTFIALIPIMPIVVSCVVESYQERQCMIEWQQNGYTVKQAEIACGH